MAGVEAFQHSERAIVVDSVIKQYGKIPALQEIDMFVPKGAIYGLLGPSGCGKTTLLRCIVGRLKVNSGKVLTLGREPGSLGHTIPGSQVGYMPQELALYQEFSVNETLTYFGRLHKMDRKYIRERISFLLDFLHLPESSRIISKLSGGQQRRTSFAIALLQEPELLILDEPTVGVDPLLRERIWEHLVAISENSKTTIIITTHYVEEARQAHMVGLMRNGRLLAEAAPDILLQKYQTQSLEDVFVKMCREDQVGDIEQNDGQATATSSSPVVKRRNGRNEPARHQEELDSLLESSPDDDVVVKPHYSFCAILFLYLPSFWNIVALTVKNLTILKSQLGTVVFEFLLPSIQIVIFCLCIGPTPYHLNMAVVNLESGDQCPTGPMTLLSNYSCYYLSGINNRTIIQKNFEDQNSAVNDVKAGNSWGVIHIPQHFSMDLRNRFINKGQNVTPEVINGSTIKVYMDMTNQQISYAVNAELLETMEGFISSLLVLAKQSPSAASLPLQYGDPIYGSNKPSFTNFMIPGVVLSITFFMATGLTALSFVLERRQGLMDRSFVAGVTAVEIMIGHILTQFLVMTVQVGLMFVFVLAVFHIPHEGSIVLALLLTLMQGFTGMAVGLLISTVCEQENSAIQAALGSVYPNLLLSGIIWPLEAMPHWLQYISQALPITYAGEAMRSILLRGWGITQTHVWRGFVVTLVWGFFLMLISAFILKIKKN